VITGTGCGDCEATELWSRDTRKGQEYLLVRGRVGAEAEKIIADIQAPVFSPDFGTVYFLSAAWAVSSAVHKVDIRSRTESFVIDGNSVFVIRTGPLRGMLLVDRALIKSDQNGNSLGRRSYLWLVSSDGKPIREIGDLDHPAVEQRRRALLDGHEDKPNQ
jgi:hypothetical protein